MTMRKIGSAAFAVALLAGMPARAAVSPDWTSIVLVPGAAPASPQNGQCWTTSAGLYCQINGAAVGPYGVGGSGGGGVSSVGLVLPSSVFVIAGSPVTTSGTLTASYVNQAANTVLAGPASGAAGTPVFRALVAAEIPAINLAATGAGGVTGILPAGSLPGGIAAATVATINGLLAQGTNVTITGAGTAASPYVISSSGGLAAAFNTITGGTNTGAAMVVGTGASLAAAGSGTIAASTVATINALLAQGAGIAITGAGTAASPYTVAATGQVTLAGAAQALTGGFAPTPYAIGTISSGTITIDCGNGPLQTLTNGGAFTLALTAAHAGNCTVHVINNGSAGAIGFPGFSEGSNTGDALTTTNASEFDIVLTRISTKTHYLVSAYQ